MIADVLQTLPTMTVAALKGATSPSYLNFCRILATSLFSIDLVRYVIRNYYTQDHPFAFMRSVVRLVIVILLITFLPYIVNLTQDIFLSLRNSIVVGSINAELRQAWQDTFENIEKTKQETLAIIMQEKQKQGWWEKLKDMFMKMREKTGNFVASAMGLGIFFLIGKFACVVSDFIALGIIAMISVLILIAPLVFSLSVLFVFQDSIMSWTRSFLFLLFWLLLIEFLGSMFQTLWESWHITSLQGNLLIVASLGWLFCLIASGVLARSLSQGAAVGIENIGGTIIHAGSRLR